MNYKNPLIVLLLVGFFAAGGGIALHYYQSSITKAEEGTPPNNTYYPPENDEIRQAKANLEKITQEELAHGCREDFYGHQVFCGESKQKVDAADEKLRQAQLDSEIPSPEVLNQRLQTVQALQDNNSLTITFQGEYGSPYLDGNTRRQETYYDNQGTEYSIDKLTGRIIHYGPAPNTKMWQKFTPVVSEAELKTKAVTYLSKHIPDFDQVQQEFTYTENVKDGGDGTKVYAFRWEGKKIQTEDMPPFVQLTLTSGGDIGTFNDTRPLYSQN